jgi:signal transduction histidine kinase
MVSSEEGGGDLERDRDSRHLRLLLRSTDRVTAARVDRDLTYTWVHSPRPDPPEEEVLGGRADALFPPDATRSTLRLNREAIETGGDVSGSIRLETPDGTRHYRATAAPTRDRAGAVDGAAFVAFDVTEERELADRAEAVRHQNEQLEEFAGVVSHDLRNPLNVAQGRIALARGETDSEHLESAARALDRMDALVEDVLELARQGRHIDDPGTVSLRTVATRAWSTTDTDDGVLEIASGPTIRADGPRLQQLLENLFRNSVEHSSTGSRTPSGDSVEHGSTGSRPEADDAVEHRAGSGDRDAGVRVRVGSLADGFYVEDDGPGIPPTHRDRVFDSGFSTSVGGTGFGLSIVENIAHAHGWEIAVTEGTDGGARFEITGVAVLDPSVTHD